MRREEEGANEFTVLTQTAKQARLERPIGV
jgi:hypothetical protein